MSHHRCCAFCASSNPDEITAELIRIAQAYLTCGSETEAEPLAAAWEHFYDACARLLQRLVGRCWLHPADQDDCVQQVWLELLRCLPAFRYDPQRGRFSTWLGSLVYSKAVDLKRRRARRSAANLDEVEEVPCPPEDDAEHECQRQSIQAKVQTVLEELKQQVPPLNAQLVDLRWREGRTVGEVAAALNMTTTQVWSREHRLKKKFRVLYLRCTNPGRPLAG